MCIPAAVWLQSAVRTRGECKQPRSLTLSSWWSEPGSYHVHWGGGGGDKNSGLSPIYTHSYRIIKTIPQKKSLSLSEVTRFSNLFHPYWEGGAETQHLKASLHLPGSKVGGLWTGLPWWRSFWKCGRLSAHQVDELQRRPFKAILLWGYGGSGGWPEVIRLMSMWHVSVRAEQPCRCLPLLATLLCGDHIPSWRPAGIRSPSQFKYEIRRLRLEKNCHLKFKAPFRPLANQAEHTHCPVSWKFAQNWLKTRL